MSIEAMLSILAFLCLLGLFLNIAIEQSQKSLGALDEFRALAEAKKCSLIIDAVFANSAGTPNSTRIDCFQSKKNFASAKSGNAEAKAIVLAPEFSLNQEGAFIVLEVKTNAHYD